MAVIRNRERVPIYRCPISQEDATSRGEFILQREIRHHDGEVIGRQLIAVRIKPKKNPHFSWELDSEGSAGVTRRITAEIASMQALPLLVRSLVALGVQAGAHTPIIEWGESREA